MARNPGWGFAPAGIAAAAVLAICACLLRFGGEGTLDGRIVLALRDPADPTHAVGPRWVEQVALNLTDLGSHTVVVLLSLAVCGHLWLRRLPSSAITALIAVAGGIGLNALLKALSARPRPQLPAAEAMATSGFPSGHALLASLVYVSLAALVARGEPRRATRIYLLAIGCGLAVLIGISRVYLGLHYPSQVAAGWIIGLAWAGLCWWLAERTTR